MYRQFRFRDRARVSRVNPSVELGFYDQTRRPRGESNRNSFYEFIFIACSSEISRSSEGLSGKRITGEERGKTEKEKAVRRLIISTRRRSSHHYPGPSLHSQSRESWPSFSQRLMVITFAKMLSGNAKDISISFVKCLLRKYSVWTMYTWMRFAVEGVR